MKNNKITGYIIRYSIATIGLALVAIGVALSIKSQLGTAPISCPPYVLSMWDRFSFTVGEYTIMMHFLFVAIQIMLLRKNFKLEYLMQLVPTFLFGYMCDFFIWLAAPIVITTFIEKLGILLISCLITAFGISIEVLAQAWMLAGEMTTSAFATVTKAKFSNVKIIFDIVCVVISAIISYILFSNIFGSSANTDIIDNLLAQTDGIAIGLGTLVSALCTGLLMKLTDPVCKFIFGRAIEKSFED